MFVWSLKKKQKMSTTDQIQVNETIDFKLVPLVRKAFLEGNFEVFQEMLDEIHFWPEGPNFFTKIPEKEHLVYWTENHLAGILSTEYLIHQQLGLELKHDRLRQFLESRVRYGSSEYLSVAYQAYTMAAVLNVVDFCEDKSLRTLAVQFCHNISRQYAEVINPFTGHVATAGGRMYSYMRKTTDKLKISPLCYLLIGQPEKNRGLDPMKFTLAYALNTTSYRLPQDAFDTIEVRRKPGVHKRTLRLTSDGISSDEPIWVNWTYGRYADPHRLFETIAFFYKHGLHHHHHFHAAAPLFALGYVSVALLWLLILLFFPIVVMLVQVFGTVSWLTGVVLHVETHVKNDSNGRPSVVVVTSAVPKNNVGRPAAQQYPCQILVNDRTIYLNYGKIVSGVKKEMSSMALMPSVHLQDGVLEVVFDSNNPLFKYKSRKDSIEVQGLSEVQEKYPEWDIRVEQTGRVVRVRVA
jgi:hypothetical protein